MSLRILVTFALSSALLVGCGAPQKKAEEPGAPIPGLKLSGKWFSTEFGDLELIQAGKNITGKYADRRGPDHNGRFRGHLKGDLIRLEWIKPGNSVAAVMPRRGRAWLRVSRDGRRLFGRWGFDDSEEDGGPWTAEKVADDE